MPSALLRICPSPPLPRQGGFQKKQENFPKKANISGTFTRQASSQEKFGMINGQGSMQQAIAEKRTQVGGDWFFWIDGLLLVVFKDWLAVAFHAYALYRESRKAPRFIYGDIRLRVFPKT
jgi:hypothetical protein